MIDTRQSVRFFTHNKGTQIRTLQKLGFLRQKHRELGFIGKLHRPHRSSTFALNYRTLRILLIKASGWKTEGDNLILLRSEIPISCASCSGGFMGDLVFNGGTELFAQIFGSP